VGVTGTLWRNLTHESVLFGKVCTLREETEKVVTPTNAHLEEAGLSMTIGKSYS